jgi:hypothetical protein
MKIPEQSVPYHELVAAADRILDECGEDVVLLSEKLDQLSDQERDELLVSDLLNAFQVFYYFFKETPGELPKARLLLSPGSALLDGLLIDKIDLIELIFALIDHQPVIVVSDGERALATFLGPDGYRDGLMYIESSL